MVDFLRGESLVDVTPPNYVVGKVYFWGGRTLADMM
jgi:hypothetical protein